MDAGTYPIARWGVKRAAARGILVEDFPHYDPDALRRRLASLDADPRREWVDGALLHDLEGGVIVDLGLLSVVAWNAPIRGGDRGRAGGGLAVDSPIDEQANEHCQQDAADDDGQNRDVGRRLDRGAARLGLTSAHLRFGTTDRRLGPASRGRHGN